jgi:hypothetical protein
MISHTPLWVWGLPLLFASPWIVCSIFLWKLLPRDGFLPPSHADLVRRH